MRLAVPLTAPPIFAAKHSHVFLGEVTHTPNGGHGP